MPLQQNSGPDVDELVEKPAVCLLADSSSFEKVIKSPAAAEDSESPEDQKLKGGVNRARAIRFAEAPIPVAASGLVDELKILVVR